MTPSRTSSGGLTRLARIVEGEKLAPVIPAPPENPTVQQAMEAWMAMARGYASIVVRQHEVDAAELAILRDFDARLTRIEDHLNALTEVVEVEGGENGDVSREGLAEREEAPTHPR